MTRTATILSETNQSALLATAAQPSGLWIPKASFQEVAGSRRAARNGMTVEIDYIAPRHVAALWPAPDPNQQRLI
jgi:hypothetical protein